MGRLQFLASLHFGLGQMNRTTSEDWRCGNELRRDARTSMIHRNSGVRRPTIETKKKIENSIIPTPLVATAALQAYLSKDIDAKSRIPRPRPAPESREKEVSRSTIPPDGKRLSNVNTLQRNVIQRSESAKPTQLRVHENDTRVAQSPLSRFQKHMKQTRAVPEWRNYHQEFTIVPQRGHFQSLHDFRRGDTMSATRTPATKNLTRSLMDKIQEAKGLRQVESANSLEINHPRSRGGLQTLIDHKFLSDSLTNAASLQPTEKSMLTVLSSSVRERQNETTTIDLTSSPPVPHAKPVIPVMLQLSPPPEKSTLEQQKHREEFTVKPTREPGSKKVKSSIDDVIVATKAVNLIQQRWRQKRLLVRSRRNNHEHGINVDQYEHSQVTLIIDKSCGGVTPLFSVAKSRKQQLTEEKKQQQHSKLENEVDLVDERGNTDEFYPSYHPWTDHELVFLEEGRCTGELNESVVMDQDELVWKRPQQIIQQLENQRVSMTKKARRTRASSRQVQDHVVFTTPGSNVNESSATISPTQKSPHCIFSDSQVVSVSTNRRTPTGKKMHQRKRKLPRVHLVKYRKFNRKPVLCAVRRSSSKVRRMFVRVLPVKGSSSVEHNRPTQIDEILCCKSSVEPICSPLSELGELEKQSAKSLDQLGFGEIGSNPSTFDRFVVFSDTGQTSIDTKLPRNDLISVGDLSLARSLLYNEHHLHVLNDSVQHGNGFIPLTLPMSVSPGTQPTIQSEVLSDDSALSPTLVTTASSGSGIGDAGQVGGMQRVRHIDEGPEDLDQHEHPGTWGKLVDVDNNAEDDSLTLSTSFVLNETPPTDPMRTLHDMKSTVTDTMTRLPTQYRDEAQIIPVAEPSRLRLDEEKRIEFLRVLDDFKRCLQPSCASSTRSSLLS